MLVPCLLTWSRHDANYTETMLPIFQPLPLDRALGPFTHADWFFEIKWDGFRALAYIENGRCRLLSRNGNEFKVFRSSERQLASRVPRSTCRSGWRNCVPG